LRTIRTASIATLGCKLNQSESDQMARQLAEAGVEIVPTGQPADLCLINSCTVTHIGDRKSRQLVRQAIRANPNAFVAVAGCYAEMEPEAVSAIEGVAVVLGNAGKGRLLESLEEQGLVLGGDKQGGVAAGFSLRVPCDDETTRRLKPAATEACAAVTRHSPHTRAFVKVQEGCDNYCSYCIVPKARGHQRSLPAGEIVEEIRRLTRAGCQEVVLTGVNITAFGRDHGSQATGESARGMGLLRLIETIISDTDISRVRLSSLQPEDWNERFYDLWDTGRICRHLHLSLQSGSDSVLRRMRRRYNTSQYARIVDEAKRALPGVAITTDVIAGFPAESESEQLETEAFLRSTGFAGLHVFKYSPRSGTVAASMAEQISPPIKQTRSDRLIALAEEMSREFRTGFASSVMSVLWEEQLSASAARSLGLDARDGRIWWSGLSDNYVRVYAPGPDSLHGTISGARIGALAGDGVLGTMVRAK
jgi:threonylcarbamoyladenosine tRNA methylthiotransferase MtaB